MVRRIIGGGLMAVGLVGVLGCAWYAVGLIDSYQRAVEKDDYAGYGLGAAFLFYLLLPATVASLSGGFLLLRPRGLGRFVPVPVRRVLGVVFLMGGAGASFVFLLIMAVVVSEFLQRQSERNVLDEGNPLVTLLRIMLGLGLIGLPSLGAAALLFVAGSRLVRRPG